MNLWQGPALWIYNDAKFRDEDFKALLKLGSGSKFSDENKIGRFGIGFNSAFNFSDLPSFVSGKYIAFLDPHAQYLPAIGKPPRRHLGNRYNFLKTDFKNRFSDQSEPYLSIEGCDFQKEFEGTLFRIPLRTREAADKSLISNKILTTGDLIEMFGNFKGNRQMLFLRNVKYCSLTLIRSNSSNLIWETKINNLTPEIEEARKSTTSEFKIYNLDMEIFHDSRKTFEYWHLCSGGSAEAKPELKKFADRNKLMV